MAKFKVGDRVRRTLETDSPCWKMSDYLPDRVFVVSEIHASGMRIVIDKSGRQWLSKYFELVEPASEPQVAQSQELEKMTSSRDNWKHASLYQKDRNIKLAAAMDRLESDLGKVRTAIGEIQFNKIVDGE